MWTPTLAGEACSLPREGAQFAAWGGPSPLTTMRGPDDDPIPIGDPDDDDYGDDDEDDDEEDDDGDYEDE